MISRRLTYAVALELPAESLTSMRPVQRCAPRLAGETVISPRSISHQPLMAGGVTHSFVVYGPSPSCHVSRNRTVSAVACTRARTRKVPTCGWLPVPHSTVGCANTVPLTTLLRYAPVSVPAVPENPLVTRLPAASRTGAGLPGV
jgi:hypothetical protein